MSTPAEKLAESLEILRDRQGLGGVAIRSRDLSRTHRERLVKGGYLAEVMKGWYVPTRPEGPAGESTAWYASFWDFCAAYLHERLQSAWCLSPEQSLLLHAGNRTVPRQLLVRSPQGGNKVTSLPHDTSLLDMRASMPKDRDIVEKDGLRLYSVPSALVACGPSFYTQYPTDARAALASIRDASEILDRLLQGGHSTIAGRLGAAFRTIGRDRIAEDITAAMRAAGYSVREQDPFAGARALVLPGRETSAYVNRLRLMWAQMREPVIERFAVAPGLPKKPREYLARVEGIYLTDAYHSLSIEGYRVSPALIERVRTGAWHPDRHAADREQRDALAARGYWQAFRAVRQSVSRVLRGEDAGVVADETHGAWYRELFAPSVTAGLLRPADLAGYRSDQVYIRQSMHVPPNRDAVRDLMPALFDLLTHEPEPSVRAVLGHFVFVYVHPYLDGNGRIGRFLMNLMLASGGYPWTVIPVEERSSYMSALETASVNQNIVPFAELLARMVGYRRSSSR